MNILMVYPNTTGNTRVPVGIVYLMTIMKNLGHNVRLFDMTFFALDIKGHSIKKRGENLNFTPVDLEEYGVVYEKLTHDEVKSRFIKEIEDFEADFVGFTVWDDSYKAAVDYAQIARDNFPDIFIAMGGVFCMTQPEMMMSNKMVDAVCIGECEESLPELVSKLEKSEDHTGVGGFWIRDRAGEIHKNPVKKPLDINEIPFMDMSLIDERHFYNPFAGHVYKLTFVEGQRGCPRRCSYCSNHIFLDRYRPHIKSYLRKKTIDRFIDELKYLKDECGFNFFLMMDDDFCLRTDEELEHFRNRYKAEVGLPFWMQVEANNVTDTKIGYLRDAGAIAASMGIESGSMKILKHVFNRPTKVEKTIEAFGIMHKHGIRTSANIIVGVPDEAREEIFETIDVARKSKPNSLSVNIFNPYKGTDLHSLCVERGYIPEDYVHDVSDAWTSVLKMPQITAEEIENLVRVIPLYSFLPEEYFPQIKRAETPDEEGNKIFRELAEIFWEIARERGIDYHVEGFDYEGFRQSRIAELKKRNG